MTETQTPADEALAAVMSESDDELGRILGDTYACTRVWAAWSYGTMGPDDFIPASECDVAQDLLAWLDAAVAACRAVDPEVGRLESVRLEQATKLRRHLDELADLRFRLEAAQNTIDEWKDASGLIAGGELGDPDGVTPAAAQAFWERVERERDEARAALATRYREGWEAGREEAHAVADDAHAYNECCRRLAWDTASAIADMTPPEVTP